MKNILFDGCSWTKGCGLEGEDINYERQKKERWSTLVSDYFGTEHVNLARGGKCNDGILRTTMQYCENNKVDFAVIQFTREDRREVINDKGIVVGSGSNNAFDPQVLIYSRLYL